MRGASQRGLAHLVSAPDAREDDSTLVENGYCADRLRDCFVEGRLARVYHKHIIESPLIVSICTNPIRCPTITTSLIERMLGSQSNASIPRRTCAWACAYRV